MEKFKVCPECSKNVLLEESVCDNCGYPFLPSEIVVVEEKDPDKYQKHKIIALSSVFVLTLVYIGYFFYPHNQNETITPNDIGINSSPIATPTQTEVPEQEAEAPDQDVINVVKNWQEIKRNAFVNGDSSILSSVLTGKALEDTKGGVNWWKNNGTFNSIELHSLDVISTEILGPTKAKVSAKLSETKDNSVQGRKTSTYTATYTLLKQAENWLISDMEVGQTESSSISEESDGKANNSESTNIQTSIPVKVTDLKIDGNKYSGKRVTLSDAIVMSNEVDRKSLVVCKYTESGTNADSNFCTEVFYHKMADWRKWAEFSREKYPVIQVTGIANVFSDSFTTAFVEAESILVTIDSTMD